MEEIKRLARQALGKDADKWLEMPMPWLGGQSPITWVGYGKPKTLIVKKLKAMIPYATRK